MPAPRDPVEAVRILRVWINRRDNTLQKDIAAELGMEPNSLAKFLSEVGANKDAKAALAAAEDQLNDIDMRAAAAADARHRSKTQEAARRLFNEERSENVGWSAFSNLLQRAADRGLDGSTPAPPPPGQVIKGLSTMHVRDPETGEMRESVVWTKTRQDAPDPIAAMSRAADVLRRAPRLAPVPVIAKPRRSALLNSAVVTDLHIGQESTVRETGAVWNVAEAQRVAAGAFDYLLSVSPPASTLLLGMLGDYLDFEGPDPQTFSNRHPLTNSASFPCMVDAATETARYLVQRGLETHDQVVLALVDGNHDPVSAIWLRKLLGVAYEREPRVSVLMGEPQDAPHCAYRFGRTMLGYAHQHLTKSSELPNLFRDTYRAMFGETEYCEVHCGHLHHFKVESYGAVKVYQHPTLAARSRHIARHGWHADRAMRFTTYHEDGGRRFEAIVTPEMIA